MYFLDFLFLSKYLQVFRFNEHIFNYHSEHKKLNLYSYEEHNIHTKHLRRKEKSLVKVCSFDMRVYGYVRAVMCMEDSSSLSLRLFSVDNRISCEITWRLRCLNCLNRVGPYTYLFCLLSPMKVIHNSLYFTENFYENVFSHAHGFEVSMFIQFIQKKKCIYFQGSL